MNISKTISRITHNSRHIVLLVILAILVFFSLTIFITYSYNQLLSQLEAVLAEELIESEKMKLNSELMELARKRTHLTSEILVTDDYFKKDELNLELETYAGEFSRIRSHLLTLPLTDEELKILENNDAIVSLILPEQRLITEYAMSEKPEDIKVARKIMYDSVLPGQNRLVKSFAYLVKIEQDKITQLTNKSIVSVEAIKIDIIETIIVVSIISLIFSIVIILRIKRVQLQLSIYSKTLFEINEGLEAQVNERTKELSDLNLKLKDSSEHDELTKLYNRRKFNEYIDSEYKHANRSNTFFSLIIIDIDYFKPYNDGYGHQEGDQCLAAVATIMSEYLPRSIDFIARYGGEEFVIILPSTDLDGALKVAETVRSAVNSAAIPHEYSSIDSHVTISMGVTVYNGGESKTIKEIIDNADQALYIAKSKGRNRVETKL